jgi:hypothetical protein
VLKALPVPTTVLLFQVGSSALILWLLGKTGIHYAYVSKETYYKAKETYYKAKETY